ncbi:hypothetical protein AB6A40_003724 [Gnathostoma spinigerum]|uniref:Uncharacterized protein n=1 Tax=Gnathostoma spinigerum TaxID=75299 RepID=A0ABD6EAF2_9BILA
MFHTINKWITLFAVWLDERIQRCSLLNIPVYPWKVYATVTYAHFLLAILLFLSGVACFCLGVTYSAMYSESNCTNGINIWIPLLNVIVAFNGLLSYNLVYRHWPSFVHFVGLCVVSFLLIIPSVYNIIAANQWFIWAQQPLDQWAGDFALIDISLAVVSFLNEIMVVLLIAFLLRYLYCSKEIFRANQNA